MKVIYGTGKVKAFSRTIAVIGVFDGVHVGHQALIRKAVAKARKAGCLAVVVTFDPHPVHVLHPEVSLQLITSVKHRLMLMEQLGVDVCVVLKFTKTFARLSAEQFVKKYLMAKLNACEVFVGDDFRFGQGRAGTLEDFRLLGEKHHFGVNVLSLVGGNQQQEHRFHKKVSSSAIRVLIQQGKLSQAKRLLGRPVSIMGQVVKGDGRGRSLGFPTANIAPDHELIPPFGVYAVRIHVKGKAYNGMANIGCRPSFPSRNPSVHIEVHILDFKKNIYGRDVIVEVVRKIRSEKIFSSPQALIDQLKKDQMKVLQIFR